MTRRAKPVSRIGDPAANALVRNELRKSGDNGRVPRHVLHYAYPDMTAKPVPAATVEAFLRGFNLLVKPTAYEGGLIAEHQSAVAGASFDKLTSTSAAALRGMGWTYDGWECAVVPKENGS